MSAPLRVLVMNSLAPPFGGAEAHVADLVGLLRERGDEVETYYPAPASGLASWRARVFDSSVHRHVRERIRAFRPDVVHVHNFLRRLSAAPFLAARKSGVATVLTVHDFQLFCPRTWALRADGTPCETPQFLRCAFGACRGGVPGAAGRAVYALNTVRQRAAAAVVRRHATRIVTHSSSLAERLRSTMRRDVGLIPLFPSPAPSGAFEAPSSRALLFVGRVAPEKGLVEFLAALPASQKLTVAGDGPSLDAASAVVRARGLGDTVEFLGRVPRERVESLARAHGAVVVPSLCLETGPIVAMEAFAAGRPVLGSRRGGIAERVREGETGFLFDPYDPASVAQALARYSSLAPAEHEAMARRSRAAAEAACDRDAMYASIGAEYRAAAAAAAGR
jgi:glycosyltransferase involved in cell wall biosynthesis